jgi:hypothetical protein
LESWYLIPVTRVLFLRAAFLFCIVFSVSGGSLQIGDRVIVASAMAGTKTGTLRYLGPTDFAKGEWAGIELDAPLGEPIKEDRIYRYK